MIAYNRQFLAEFEHIRYEGEELAAAGEHVVAKMRITGVGKTSGAGFELSAWWAFTIRDGQVVQVYAYLDKDASGQGVFGPQSGAMFLPADVSCRICGPWMWGTFWPMKMSLPGSPGRLSNATQSPLGAKEGC